MNPTAIGLKIPQINCALLDCEKIKNSTVKTKETKKHEEMNILCNERCHRGFVRQFTFPEMVSEKRSPMAKA